MNGPLKKGPTDHNIVHNMFFLIVSVFVSSAFAIQDLDCTSNGAYTSSAVSCENKFSDATCLLIYKEDTVKDGGNDERPLSCFNGADGPSDDLKAMAVANCPKLCGYCCKTPEFSCENAKIPRINCATVSPQMCKNPAWRSIIAEDCPSACGFCNLGGCVDKSDDCASQPTICTARGLEQFAEENCKRTCGLCNSAPAPLPLPTAAPIVPASCVDSSTGCASWIKNGFCQNSAYSLADKKKFCAKGCNLC